MAPPDRPWRDRRGCCARHRVEWLTPGFPERWVIDVTGWFDAFRDWTIQNSETSPLFIYFLNPIGDFASWVVDSTILLLERMTWFGLIVTAAAIAGLAAGWKMALLAAAGFLSFGLLGVWDAAIETLALMLVAVVLALAIGIPFGIWAGRRQRVERVLRPIWTRCRRSRRIRICCRSCCCSASATPRR